MSSSGFPGSFFTNDPTYPRGDSPTSFDFSLLDVEKVRKGAMGYGKDGPMDFRPYTAESSKYSVHTLTFETSTNGPKTPVMTVFPPPGTTSAAIIRVLNKGNEKALPTVKGDSQSRPMSYITSTDSDGPKSTIFTRGKKKSWIQPPPEVYLKAPPKESRLRKETPSLMTQATGTSTNSDSQVVISFASKNTVASATARTLLMNTMSSGRVQSPVDSVMPREDRPSIDSGSRINFNMVPQQRPTLVRTVNGTQRMTQFSASASRETVGGTGQDSKPDGYGRI